VAGGILGGRQSFREQRRGYSWKSPAARFRFLWHGRLCDGAPQDAARSSANFEFSFYIRGTAPANTLQFKLIDASGDNVWWVNWPDYEFPAEWRRVTIKKRQIRFAWGPSTTTVEKIAALELVVSAGSGGGQATVVFDGLGYGSCRRSRSAHPCPSGAGVLRATSSTAAEAADGDMPRLGTAIRNPVRRSS